jgi:hypothetical protein
VSYNGGPYGLQERPTPSQLALAQERRYPLTTVQRQHIAEASRDRNLLVTVNHGKPTVVVVARPLSASHPPADFKPITTADRQTVGAKPAAPVAKAPVPAAAKPAAQPEVKAPVHAPAKQPAQPAAKQPSHAAAKPPAHAAAKQPAHAAKQPAQSEKPQSKPASGKPPGNG